MKRAALQYPITKTLTSQMKLKIRKGSVPDFPQIFQLINAFALQQGTPGKVTITLEEMIGARALFNCLVAEAETGEVVGFASFYFAYYSWTGKALYLDDLYVKDGYRDNGIGSALLAKVLQLARSENCKKLRWQVAKWNTRAIEFYKRMGATIDEVEANCDIVIRNEHPL